MRSAARSKRRPSPRSAVEPQQILRWVTAGVALLLLTLAAGANALDNVSRVNNPALAARIGFAKGLASGLLADRLVTATPDSPAAVQAAGIQARAGLAGTVFNPAALRVLGLQATLARDSDRALRLFEAARTVSRRDTATQLLLIEAYAASGRAAEALDAHDAALRINPGFGQTLFPVLAGAVEDPELRPLISRKLRASPWTGEFVDWATSESGRIPLIEPILPSLPAGPRALTDGRKQAIIKALVTERRFAPAFALYDRWASGKALAIGDQLRTSSNYAPIDWEVQDAAELAVSLSGPPAGRRVVELQAGPEVKAAAVVRLIRLPAGAGVLTGRAEGADGLVLRGSWTLECAQNGARIADVPVRAQQPTPFTGGFVVPNGCSYQWLRLMLEGGNPGGVPQAGRVTALTIRAEAGGDKV